MTKAEAKKILKDIAQSSEDDLAKALQYASANGKGNRNTGAEIGAGLGTLLGVALGKGRLGKTLGAGLGAAIGGKKLRGLAANTVVENALPGISHTDAEPMYQSALKILSELDKKNKEYK